ncbi:cytochrome P450, partial [Choiromyces venosus 120613-1]
MSRNKRVWDKLQQEVLSAVERDERPDFNQGKDMKYLRCVLNETYHNTTLPAGGGPDGQSPILIPAGKKVIYSIFEFHRRKDIWGPDVDELVPERWEDGRHHAWEFMLFNARPRICV